MVFSPAQVTGSKAGGTLNTSGSVAILVSAKLHTHKTSPHMQYVGYNWAAVTITLAGGFHMNLVTSYTKHGHGIEALGTFTKVREYLDTFTIPYIWGGDFNRPPEQLTQETANNGLGIRCFAPQGVHSTCSNGGLIDYYASHVSESDILKDVAIVRDAPISPHFPVQARVPANIKDTMVKTQVTAPDWPVLIGPLLEPWTWEQSQHNSWQTNDGRLPKWRFRTPGRSTIQ